MRAELERVAEQAREEARRLRSDIAEADRAATEAREEAARARAEANHAREDAEAVRMHAEDVSKAAGDKDAVIEKLAKDAAELRAERAELLTKISAADEGTVRRSVELQTQNDELAALREQLAESEEAYARNQAHERQRLVAVTEQEQTRADHVERRIAELHAQLAELRTSAAKAEEARTAAEARAAVAEAEVEAVKTQRLVRTRVDHIEAAEALRASQEGRPMLDGEPVASATAPHQEDPAPTAPVLIAQDEPPFKPDGFDELAPVEDTASAVSLRQPAMPEPAQARTIVVSPEQPTSEGADMNPKAPGLEQVGSVTGNEAADTPSVEPELAVNASAAAKPNPVLHDPVPTPAPVKTSAEVRRQEGHAHAPQESCELTAAEEEAFFRLLPEAPLSDQPFAVAALPHSQAEFDAEYQGVAEFIGAALDRQMQTLGVDPNSERLTDEEYENAVARLRQRREEHEAWLSPEERRKAHFLRRAMLAHFKAATSGESLQRQRSRPAVDHPPPVPGPPGGLEVMSSVDSGSSAPTRPGLRAAPEVMSSFDSADTSSLVPLEPVAAAASSGRSGAWSGLLPSASAESRGGKSNDSDAVEDFYTTFSSEGGSSAGPAQQRQQKRELRSIDLSEDELL